MKTLRYILVVCLLLGMGSTLWASVGVAIMDEDGNIISATSSFKSPPLRTSDTIRVVIDKHSDVDIPNWAGFRLKFHILDSKEVSVTPASVLFGFAPVPPATTPGAPTSARVKLPLVSPEFPQSTPMVQSVPFTTTVWHPTAPASGTLVEASQWVGLAAFELHAKSTTPKNNSDVDMTVMAWCIRHLLPGTGTTQIEESAWVWATSHFQPTPDQPLPSFGPEPGDPNGHWVHIPFRWHVPPGIGSQFIATLAGTAVIGLEHVPEAMTGVMALTGGAVLVCSRILRRRRLALD